MESKRERDEDRKSERQRKKRKTERGRTEVERENERQTVTQKQADMTYLRRRQTTLVYTGKDTLSKNFPRPFKKQYTNQIK